MTHSPTGPVPRSTSRSVGRTAARTVAGLAVALLSLAALAGCGGGGNGDAGGAGPASAPTSPTSPSATPTRATPAPEPAADACYRLTFDQALATTARGGSEVSCRKHHTSETYAVGSLDSVVDGHLLAVDSARVRRQVSTTCPRQLATYLGGSVRDLRLSMVRPVWFTPSVEESDQGQRWYRCDAVAIAGPSSLLSLSGRLKGVLGSDRADDYAMCSTAEPGASGFRRVPCVEKHAWRALSTVPVTPARHGAYPGVADAKAAGRTTCRDAAKDAADDALDYQWGYEWPTAQEWDSGQTYGICWAPD